MTDQGFIRARSAAHKEQRAGDILAAATTVLDRTGIEGTTLSAIADEAGVAKSAVYRYFESREEILIRILSRDAVALIGRIGSEYAALSRKDDHAAMARIFARGFAEAPRFCLLISQMAPILERNISVETITQIKLGFLEHLGRMAASIEKASPLLGGERAVFLVRTLTDLAAGSWPTSHPAPPVAKALEHEELAVFRSDFESNLARAAEALMTGLAAAPE